MNIGILGLGCISGIYLKNLTSMFKNVHIYACADLDEEKVAFAMREYGIPRAMTFDEMLQCKDIDMILNITPPRGHYALSKKALLAGKHVYVEKPLALTYKEGRELIEIAEEKGLYFGCSPDTFLGAGIQTCLKLIDDGKIGRPIGATAFMMCHGHESWHPSPEFYYDIGGGPLFDMGPYYITALVKMLGRAKSVFAYTAKAFENRTITSKPKYGQNIPVHVDTHVAGMIRFDNNAIATLIMSFDVWRHTMPKIEIYGTEGSINVPDPNTFGGTVRLATANDKEFQEIPLISPYCDNSRGIGLAETVNAIAEKRVNNASGRLGLHVLEIMEGLIKSATEGKEIMIESAPSSSVPLDWNVEIGQLKTKE